MKTYLLSIITAVVILILYSLPSKSEEEGHGPTIGAPNCHSMPCEYRVWYEYEANASQCLQAEEGRVGVVIWGTAKIKCSTSWDDTNCQCITHCDFDSCANP